MSINMTDKQLVRVLRMRQVQERLGLGRSTIYDRMDPESPRYDSTFPRPISLGSAAVGWIESEINQWLQARASARSHNVH